MSEREAAVTAISAEITPPTMGAPARLTITMKVGDTDHRVTIDHETGEFRPFDVSVAMSSLGYQITGEWPKAYEARWA